MQVAKMVKLILAISTTVATALLVIAFVSPAAASGAVRTVAPAVQFAATVLPGAGLLSAQPASGTKDRTVSPQFPGNRGSGSSILTGSTTTNGLAEDDLGSNADSHSISTPSHANCGRYGSGFHGGKHNFTCPNRPFPVKSHF